MKGKWTVLAFLCGIFVIYTVDRALLGLLAIPIQKETGLSDLKFGCLSSAIFWTYAVVVPFAGLAGDRFNRGRLIGVAVIAWSVMTVLAGFADGFWSLFLLVSFAIVAPQTLYSPSANALIASLHRETRTLAMSCHQAAYYTGWFVSGAAVAAVLSVFGTWRSAFFVFGSVGVVVGVAFLLLARGDAVGGGAAGAAKPRFRDSFKAFFGCKTALLLGVGYIAEVFAGYGYSAWGPKFVATKFDISPAAAGTGVMFWHYAASFGAILVAGWLTDALIRRMPRFRLALAMAAMALSIPMLALFGLGTALTTVWIAAAAYGATRGIFGANQFAAIFDVVPPIHRSAMIGFLNVLAGLIGSLAPIVLGWLSGRYGTRGFELGFAAMGSVQLLAIAAFAVAFLFTYRKDRIQEV